MTRPIVLTEHRDSVVARMRRAIRENGPVHPYDTSLGRCVEWTGPRNWSGYGSVWNGAETELAHRVAWALARGEPGELCVLHSCDNRLCCNPDHLFLGTRTDNNDDKLRKGRQAKGETSGAVRHPASMARPGDQNGNRRRPDHRATGERNGAHTHPEQRPSGARNGAHTKPWRVRRGADHGASKLSAADVAEMRRLAACGMRINAIGARFGVSDVQAGNVVRRKSWSHVA